jgi:tRNA threonylcarbamoyladenosine biosynthesis protein TsaE
LSINKVFGILILETRKQHWANELACQRSAQHLAALISSHGALIELHGTLGAGKTTWTRYLLQALGVTGRVKSPTYALMEVYELPGLSVSHFDFYRFNDAQEWEDAGFRDVFANPGLKLVEWPEKALGLLPVPDLRITIEPGLQDDRSVCFEACTARGVGLLS